MNDSLGVFDELASMPEIRMTSRCEREDGLEILIDEA